MKTILTRIADLNILVDMVPDAPNEKDELVNILDTLVFLIKSNAFDFSQGTPNEQASESMQIFMDYACYLPSTVLRTSILNSGEALLRQMELTTIPGGASLQPRLAFKTASAPVHVATYEGMKL